MGSSNAADIVFMFLCTALVFLMTPGLAFFYGGMVRKKHVLSIMMQNFVVIGLITLIWVLFGYSLAFGPDHFHLIGDLKWFGLKGVDLAPNPQYSSTIPQLLFFLFQLMFAIITPAVLTGSTAERLRFPAFVLLVTLWSTFVYIPLVHWTWGNGGWLRNLGLLDFAGGIPVETASGISGLITAMVIGKRNKHGKDITIPHNMPSVVLGAGLLWFGWFGFNAGSALGANTISVLAMATTQIAGAAGMLGWIILELLHRGKISIFGAVSGSISALVAITPAAGFVAPVSSIFIGFVAGGLSYFAVISLKHKLGYDDTLDVFGIHGVSGTWGTIAVGLFADLSVNAQGANGLWTGGGLHLLGIQLLGLVTVYVYAGGMTWAILKVISLFTPLLATRSEQETGLDLTQHGENAYPDFEPGETVFL